MKKQVSKDSPELMQKSKISFLRALTVQEEAYKKEILRLRIENERLKKNYTVRTNEAGEQEYVRLKPKNLK